jgi:hypothetical protein
MVAMALKGILDSRWEFGVATHEEQRGVTSTRAAGFLKANLPRAAVVR